MRPDHDHGPTHRMPLAPCYWHPHDDVVDVGPPQHASFASLSQHVAWTVLEQQLLPSATAVTVADRSVRGANGRVAVLRDAATEPQQLAPAVVSPPAATGPEQTPVSGNTSSTRRAASQSPARAATIERTCS